MPVRRNEYQQCGPRDTGSAALRTVLNRLKRAALLTLAIPLLATCASAAPREIKATLIAQRDGRAYVLSSDSGFVVPGWRLTFQDGGRLLASGEVVSVADGRVAAVRLSSGSLARVRRLDRVRLFGEPDPGATTRVLRVGYPGARRASLLFRGGGDDSIAIPGYTRDGRLGGAVRMVRDAGANPGGPDTIDTRAFADAADQEIALERGELDAAVFWPGELSARMRGDSRWTIERGVRSRIVLAALAPGITGAVFPDLNRELFAGDLLPWPAAEDTVLRPGRWLVVDQALPGAALLQQALSRPSAHRDAPMAGPPAVTVTLLDLEAIAPQDSSGMLARGITPLFSIRLLVVAAPGARDALRAVGPDALADLPRAPLPRRMP